MVHKRLDIPHFPNLPCIKLAKCVGEHTEELNNTEDVRRASHATRKHSNLEFSSTTCSLTTSTLPSSLTSASVENFESKGSEQTGRPLSKSRTSMPRLCFITTEFGSRIGLSVGVSVFAHATNSSATFSARAFKGFSVDLLNSPRDILARARCVQE